MLLVLRYFGDCVMQSWPVGAWSPGKGGLSAEFEGRRCGEYFRWDCAPPLPSPCQ